MMLPKHHQLPLHWTLRRARCLAAIHTQWACCIYTPQQDPLSGVEHSALGNSAGSQVGDDSLALRGPQELKHRTCWDENESDISPGFGGSASENTLWPHKPRRPGGALQLPDTSAEKKLHVSKPNPHREKSYLPENSLSQHITYLDYVKHGYCSYFKM